MNRESNNIDHQPKSQGALQRFHQTLKNIRSYCFESDKYVDEGIHLFFLQLGNLYRNLLVLAHLSFWAHCSWTLKFLKREILSPEDTPFNLLQYVSDFRNKLLKACEAVRSSLKSIQGKMIQIYDKNTKERSFNLEIRF